MATRARNRDRPVTGRWIPNLGDGPAMAAEFDTARARAAGVLLVRLGPYAGAAKIRTIPAMG
jgi:hypothetical protein